MSHPVGSYIAEVISATVAEAQSGTPGLAIKFQTEQGTITETKWITPKTVEYLYRDLDTLGISEKRLATLKSFGEICQALLGAQCEIVVEEGDYKGKPQWRVKYINALPTEVSGDAAERAFGLLTGKVVKPKTGPISQPRPPAERPGAKPIIDDSDLPF